MKILKKIIYITLVVFLIFISVITLFFYLIDVTWIDYYNIKKYGHPSPANYIGMTREELFQWADKHRVNLSKKETNKVALGVYGVAIADNLDGILNHFERKKYIKTSDSYSIGYRESIGGYYYYIVTLKDGIVVSQRIYSYSDL